MEQLLALNRNQMHALWDSVWGDRLYHWLRGAATGDDGAPIPNELQKSLGHSHVLAPEHRSAEGAWAVAHKLLHKAAMRLRMEKFYAGAMHVAIRYQLTKQQAERVKSQKHFSGIRHSGWGMEARFAACQDTLTLLNVLRGAWAKRPEGPEFVRPFFVGVTMHNLIPESEYQASLFGDPDNRAELAATMDKLNLKYGHTTLHFAGMLPAKESAPTRIAFTQIPVQYGVDYM
jgi:DNA polymerase-4